MCQAFKTGVVQCGIQNARSDAYGFRDVVVFAALALSIDGGLFERNRDQRRRGLQKRFVGISARWRQSIQSFIEARVT